jgi:hypothetical protein
MKEIAEKFTFNPMIKKQSRTRPLEEIEKSQNLRIAFRCSETGLLIGKKMQEKKLKPYLIQFRAGPTKRHFEIGFLHKGEEYVAAFEEGHAIKLDYFLKEKKKYSNPFRINLPKLKNHKLENILPVSQRRLHFVRDFLLKFRPRYLPTNFNKKRDIKKANKLNKKIKNKYKLP